MELLRFKGIRASRARSFPTTEPSAPRAVLNSLRRQYSARSSPSPTTAQIARRAAKTHGSGPVARHQGSLGACSDPSRVMKGKKLPGHLGAERVTVQNLEIVKIDAENNLIAIKGAIPGPKGGVVSICDSVKA